MTHKDRKVTKEGVEYDLVREDGRLERMCHHGVGHTVGFLGPLEKFKGWGWVHGCDGCCAYYQKQEVNLEDKSPSGTTRTRPPKKV